MIATKERSSSDDLLHCFAALYVGGELYFGADRYANNGDAALGFWLLGEPIINLMTTAEDVRAAAPEFLIWVAVAPLIGLPAWMLDGIFIGATRTRDMRNGMLISLPVFLVAVWAFTPLWGNHGLWAAMMVFFAFRGITLGMRYGALERSAEA